MSRRRPVLITGVVFSAALTLVAAQKLTPDEIVKRHTAGAFGPAGPAPAPDVGGTCRVTTVMGAGALDGTFELASTSDTSRWTLRLGSPTYEGESVVFDGRQVDVGFALRRMPGRRSALGLFLSMNPVLVREGLLGGVLNGRWPLRAAAARDAKLSYDGVKKLDGRELHRMRYRANRQQGDLTVHLYFEPDTFRHVASVYVSSRTQSVGFSPETSSQQADHYFTLEERFTDFEPTPGGAMPKGWLVRYTRTGNTVSDWKYDCRVQSPQRDSDWATAPARQ